MGKKKKTTNAIEILHNRYIGDDADRKASLKEERANAEVARTVYELREESGLTQKELANLIGTTQSVISRLEDADYEGHSLSMLSRIAKALNKRLKVQVIPKDKEVDTVRYAFPELMNRLRRKRGLKISELAQKLDIDVDEALAIERDITYDPDPLTLFKLSKFYKVPQRQLAMLTGAIKDVPVGVREQASRFAAKSESFSKLTDEEKHTLDEFVKFLRAKEKET
jgi:transcriptional regulator with XRE-family HTH domain